MPAMLYDRHSSLFPARGAAKIWWLGFSLEVGMARPQANLAEENAKGLKVGCKWLCVCTSTNQ